jgi:hypothetical protein
MTRWMVSSLFKKIVLTFSFFLPLSVFGAKDPQSQADQSKKTQSKAAQSKADLKNLPKSLGKFGGWEAYVINEKGKKVCYMFSYAQRSKKGTPTQKNDSAYLMVTHRPDSQLIDVFSHHVSYSFKPHQQVLCSVTKKGQKKDFTLFTEGKAAWAPNSQIDHDIVKMCRTDGLEVIVKGTSSKGKEITDVYTLKGFAQAYKAIGKACGVNF